LLTNLGYLRGSISGGGGVHLLHGRSWLRRVVGSIVTTTARLGACGVALLGPLKKSGDAIFVSGFFNLSAVLDTDCGGAAMTDHD